VTAIPLGSQLLGASSNLTRRSEYGHRSRNCIGLRLDGTPRRTIRSASRWGLPCRPRAADAVALTTPFHPYRSPYASNPPRKRGGKGKARERRSALCFGANSLSSRPRSLSGTVCPWSPDFPPGHLSGLPERRPATDALGMGTPRGPRVKGQRPMRRAPVSMHSVRSAPQRIFGISRHPDKCGESQAPDTDMGIGGSL